MKQSDLSDKLTQLTTYGILIILVLMPFHAFITTWLGSVFGAPDVIKIWKEVVLSVLALLAIVIAYRDKDLRNRIRRDLLFKLIGLYILLHLLRAVVALINEVVTSEAVLFALIINLRFLVIFSVAYVVGSRSNWLHNNWHKIVLWPAAVVIIFGLLQQFVLPKDFLTHFGYGEDSIAAITTVDEKTNYTRLMSTTRGANPLGAYLVLIITSYVLLNRKRKIRYQRYIFRTGGLVAILIIMVFTYSRSAWLGLVLSLATLLWVNIRSSAARRYFLFACVCVAIAVSSFLWAFRDNNIVQNSLFHTDESSISAQSSNSARWQATSSGVRDIIREPLGRGPGTAGPASARTENPRLSENYFVQIGQEAGVVGVVIFVAINILVGLRLWRRKSDKLAFVLFCSLLGITLINLLLHAWADDTLALLWWGLAGIALSAKEAGILKRKHEQKAN